MGISLGDLGLAYQAFKVAVSIDPNHGEALNNIAVLEMRRQKFEVAKACLSTSCEVSTFPSHTYMDCTCGSMFTQATRRRSSSAVPVVIPRSRRPAGDPVVLTPQPREYPAQARVEAREQVLP